MPAIIDKINATFGKKPLLLYCVSAFFLALTIFAFFALQGRTLIRYGDGLNQWYINFCYMHDVIVNLFSGKGFNFWSWQLGLGGDNLSYLSTYLFNPTTWICGFFPKENMDICYGICVLLNLFFAGFTTCLFLKHRQVKNWICVSGGLAYAFSFWSITVINQFIFLFPPVLFPLILMGIDFIFDKKSPLLLIVSCSVMALNYLYFTYMIAIICFFYVFLKAIKLAREKCLKVALKRTFSTFGYVLLAILIISPILLPSLYSFLQLNSDTDNYFKLYPTISDFFSFLPAFTSPTETTPLSNYGRIGVLPIFVLMLPFLSDRVKRGCIDSIMLLVLMVFAFIPALRSFMNGGSYPASRFLFMLVFFLIVSTSQLLTDSNLKKIISLKKIIIFAVILVALETVNVFVLFNCNLQSFCYLLFNVVAGTLIAYSLLKAKKKALLGFGSSFLVLLFSITLIFAPWGADKSTAFASIGEAKSVTEKSALKEATPSSDDDFYRNDTIAHSTIENENNYDSNTNYINENLYFNVCSVSTYTSLIDKRYQNFNRQISNGNAYRYRTQYFSNDNRPGIDYLLGVKNFYLDASNLSKTSAFAGSYFVKTGREIKLTSKYNPSLGYVFAKKMSSSEYEKLNAAQKEQALLQTLIVDGEGETTSDFLNLQSTVAPTTIKNVNGKESTEKGFEKKKNQTKQIKISFDNAYENYDIYLSVKNLHRKAYSQLEEYNAKHKKKASGLKKFNLERINTTKKSRESFTIDVTYNDCSKSIVKPNSHQSLVNMQDFVCYLGSYDGKTNELTFSTEDFGTFSWDSIEVIQVPKGALDDCMQNLESNSLKVNYVGNDVVTGNVSASENGYLFLSVLKTPGWKVFIDGAEVETFTADTAFTGCEISAGQHSVELRYAPPWSNIGLVLLPFGVLGFIACLFYRRKNRTKSTK